MTAGATAPRRRAELSIDSLPLTLPAPPSLPRHLRLEVAIPCAEAFDDPDWRFTVDWDGARALLIAGADGSVRLHGATPIDLAGRFPEMAQAAECLGGRAAILEGVVAVLDSQGRPDLAGFGRRLAAGAATAPMAPAVFLAIDLLHMDGAAIVERPLDRRLQALAGLITSTGVIQVPDHVVGRGRDLAAAAIERGLAGLLARRGDATYRSGIASPHRLRVALALQLTCVVLGVERAARAGLRIVLGEFVEGQLVECARVAGPRDRPVERWLEQSGSALTATVAHSGRKGDGSLRQPLLIAVRDDVDPQWCVRRQPMAPPRSGARNGGFIPTVLMPLPFGEVSRD